MKERSCRLLIRYYASLTLGGLYLAFFSLASVVGSSIAVALSSGGRCG